MLKYFATLLLLTSTSSFFAQNQSQETPFVPGELIVMLQPGVEVSSLIRDFGHMRDGVTGMRHAEELSHLSNIHLFAFDEGAVDGFKLLTNVRNSPKVRAAQFNHYVKERATPNDPLLGQQWHHINANDADIDSDLAWDITTGGTTANGDQIVVCVIEPGGSNYNHTDLIANHWRNLQEIPGNGIDDDGNGYVDDYNGWRPSTNSDNVQSGGHGTAVSGMIGAKGNNGIGGVGVNWDVKIMQVQVGSLTESNVIAAYAYPYTMRNIYNQTQGAQGAFVVATNASWGIDNANPANYPVWCAYYDDLGAVGILNCGATANNNVNIDVVGDMPTGCGSDYMVSVTATNNNDLRTFSGYGLTTIDLGAPGASVLLPSGSSGYSSTSGTSFASPCVAGGIALIYSAPCETLASLAIASPQAAADAVRGYIMNGVDQTTQLLSETVSGGRLNVHNSLNLALDNCGPPPTCEPEGMTLEASCYFNSATNTTQAQVTVSAVFESNLCSATQVCYRLGSGAFTCIDINAAGGSLNNSNSFTVTGLQSGAAYTFYYTGSGGSSTAQVVTTPACNQLVAGCTNPDALNYNPNATIDNGSCVLPCINVTLSITTDCWGGEVSWEIIDAEDNTIASIGTGTYGNQQTYTWSGCLDYGCFTFNIYDSFGDGMNGAQWGGCNVNGTYSITNNETGDALVTMTAPNANYGSGATHSFCLEGGPVEPTEPPCADPYPAVTGLQRTVLANGVQLSWTPILGSLGCQIQGGLANGSGGLTLVQVIQTNMSSFFIPASQLPVSDIYRVRVRCGCSQNPQVVGGWSPYEFFFWGDQGRSSEAAQRDGVGTADVQVFPNPSDGDFVLQINVEEESQLTVRVYDLLGKLVYSTIHPASNGFNTLRLSIPNLDPAMYMLQVDDEHGTLGNRRIVIRK